MRLWAAARRAAVAAPPTRIRVDGSRLRHGDGALSVVIATGDLDLRSLDERGRAAAVEGFARLCRSLDVALQIAVRVRRVPAAWAEPGGSVPAGPIAQFGAAMVEHWRERLLRQAVFRRSVALVLTAGADGDRRLEQARRLAIDAVRAAGVSGHVLEGGSLAGWVGASFEATGGGDLAGWAWRESPLEAVLGRTRVRGHLLRRLPGSPVEPGWLAPVMNVAAECDVAVHLLPVPASEAVSSLGRRLRGLSAQQLLEVDRGSSGDPWNEAAIESAVSLRDGLARNQGRPLRLSLCAVARGRDLASLERSAREVRAAFAATLAGAEPATFQHLHAALSAAPLGRDLLGPGKLVDSRAAATCLPWTGAGIDDPGGYRLGCCRATGAPIRVDPFDVSVHGNANLGILAASGQGKSFAIGALVMEAAVAGTPSVIVDPEEEYRPLVAALGGRYLRLAPDEGGGGGGAINILETGGAQAVVDLAQVLCDGRLGEVERAQVDRAATGALERAARAGRAAVLGDCVEELRAGAPGVALVLERLCAGPLGRLFNRPTSIGLDGGVTGVSVRDLSPEFVPAATLLLARWLWQGVRDRRARRHVIFDEAGILAQHAPLRELLGQLARRCRKYGASLVVATQNARDLLGSDAGLTVATNCAVLLLGGHRAAETAEMQRAFGLTEGQRRFLEGAGRGEFLLVAGNRRAEIRIEVPELHRRVLAPRGAGD